MNVSETRPGLLEKSHGCEMPVDILALSLSTEGLRHSFFPVSLVYPKMYLLLVNPAFMRKLILSLNSEFSKIGSIYYL